LLCPDCFEAENVEAQYEIASVQVSIFSSAENYELQLQHIASLRAACTFDSSVDTFTVSEARCISDIGAHFQQELRNRRSGNKAKDPKR
jgi:hypothetical protein